MDRPPTPPIQCNVKYGQPLKEAKLSPHFRNRLNDYVMQQYAGG